MRQTMHHVVVAMAAVLWIAMPQAKAQTVGRDLDPGIMYLFSNEEKNIAFEEGNEWEIIFTNTDTLGNEHASPVGMMLKGGVRADSMYVDLHTIDSILMYQPEPQMQEGVFVITRDYFPYIAAVDSFTTIHFDSSLPYDLPSVGQRVVCNIYEVPLRNGFIGTVLDVCHKDGLIVMECEPYIEDLKDFYSYFLYSGAGGYTEEQQKAVDRMSQTSRVRRGIVAQPRRTQAENDNDNLWESPKIGYDFKLTSRIIDFENLRVGGNYGVKGVVGTNITLFPTTLGAQLPGVSITFDGIAQGKIEVEAKYDGVEPIGKFGESGSVSFPLNSKGEFAIGFLIGMEGSASFSAVAEPHPLKTTLNILWDSKRLSYVPEIINDLGSEEIKLKEWVGSIKGAVDFRLGGEEKFKFLGGKVEAVNSSYIVGMQFGGQIDLFKEVPYPESDNPAELFENYETTIKGNRLSRSSLLKSDYKVDVKVPFGEAPIGFGFSKSWTLAEISYNLLPMTKSSFELTNPHDSNCELKIKMANDGYSVAPCYVWLWAYNEDLDTWAMKLPMGEIGSLNDSEFSFTEQFNLDPGYNYSICSVYQPINSNLYMSDVLFVNGSEYQQERVEPRYVVKDLFIPYNVQIERPVIDNFSTITLKGRCLEEYEEIEGATYGFLVEKQYGETIDIPVDMVINGEFEAEMEVTTLDFSVMAYMDVEGKRRSYSERQEVKGISLLNPIIIDPTDIDFNQATLHMKVSMMYDDEATWSGYFECWEKGKKETTMKRVPVNYDDVTDGVITGKIKGLTPQTDYVVGATLNFGGLKYEATETKAFTTKAPIKDMVAEPSYGTATLKATLAVTLDPETEVYLYIDDDPTMAKPKTKHKVMNEECQTVGREVKVTHEAEELKQNTNYYFQVVVKSNSDDEFVSDIATFKTLDAYTIATTSPATKSTAATLRATVTDYILNEAQSDANIIVRFYYGKSKSGVKNHKSDYVDVNIGTNPVEGRIEGLQKENKYYYQATILYKGEVKGMSDIASFTTPDPYDVSTLNAEVEDATVTLRGKMTLEAYEEFLSDEHNTIIAGFEYSTSREALSSGNGEGVTRLLEVELNEEPSNATFETTIDLEPGTIYYYRAFIYVDGESFVAGIKNFKTLEYDGGLIPLARKKGHNANVVDKE